MQGPHVLTAKDVLENHATIAGQGLSSAEAAQQLNTRGPNELAEKGKKQMPGVFCWQPCSFRRLCRNISMPSLFSSLSC